MKLLFALILFVALTGCTLPPGLQGVANGNFSMGGTCEIDKAGWHINHDEKEDMTTFTFWVKGGTCDYDN